MFKIRKGNIFPCERIQYVGYCRAYEELVDGTRLHMETFSTEYCDTQEEAWSAFTPRFKEHISSRPGVLLWRMPPEAIVGDKGFGVEGKYSIMCRSAITEDLRFTDESCLLHA